METGFDKFTRLMAARLPKAVHHIGLLKNLAAYPYGYTEAQAKAVVAKLEKVIADVRMDFGVDAEQLGQAVEIIAKAATPVPIAHKPPSIDEAFISDVRWALDKLIMNDPKTAQALLIRALTPKTKDD